jgi:hypothetical protein
VTWLFACVVIAHGIAHLVGFAVPFGLVANPDLSERTTVLNGALDVGETGAKVIGILWLALALGFFAAGAAILTGRWDPVWMVRLAALSLVFCVIGWPDARIGVAVNLAIIAALFALRQLSAA